MNILSSVIEKVTINFEESLEKYHLKDLLSNNSIKSFDNYINMVSMIDDVSTCFSTTLYSSFLSNLDKAFFNSIYRKKHCECIGFYNRTIITLFGFVTYKRRRYFDKVKNKEYFFVDDVLFLNKNKCFDPFVCAKVCDIASIDSYAKAGRTVSEIIGRRLKLLDDPFRCIISRAAARNIVLNFNIPDIAYTLNEDVNTLYIMLNEKFVHSQFNNGKDWMVKSAVVFENVKSVYKYKKKSNSKIRYKLTGKKIFASVDNDLHKQVVDYVYYSYNTDKIKKIIFMGDCANWITSFPEGFKFHKDLIIIFCIDGFHYVQALEHILTKKYIHLLESFKNVIKNNNKQGFINLCNVITEYEQTRKDTILEKQNYILNNWKYIQNYYAYVDVKCSMESHISHCFADLFTSRPRAYSFKGIKQLLKLRLLRVNNIDIQKVYFDVLKGKYNNSHIIDSSVFHPFDIKKHYYNVDWIPRYFSSA